MNINKNPTVVSGGVSQDKNQFSLTTLEIVFTRIFAILLILTTIPLFLSILTLPTIIVFGIFGIFLFFSKKYHLFANIIFLIFAMGVYFVPLPIGWGWFRILKEYRLSTYEFNLFSYFFIAPIIFVSFSVRNVLGNIFAYFKTSTALRNVYFLVTLIVVLATLLAYPFLDPFRLRDQSLGSQEGTGDLGFIVIRQTLTFIDQYHKEDGFTSRLDPSTKKYIYRLHLLKPLQESLQFTKVEADGEQINFITDSQVQCLNCQKDVSDPYGLVFPAGKDIDFIVTSNQLIKVIKFTEPGNKMDEFVFWK